MASTAYTIPQSVSSINEQNKASMAYTALQSISFTDEQITTSITSIDCINFNNLVLIFTAFVQAMKSDTLLPNTRYTSYMHPQSIMTSALVKKCARHLEIADINTSDTKKKGCGWFST
ncbi:16535_t:CDS:2 [Funneliformis caledonium]|uniref:16535_t:CDS:1 n=1 Tax=Funneliformis caledonium TaxID=1117310 RepID=A0A9N9N617_9GLOM|nr:16535_t:CDS:2 [Funneliformis caledonium]